MLIRICNYLAGSFLLESEPNEWDAVVILDSSAKPTRFVSEFARTHLVVHFDDVVSPRSGKRQPTVRDVRAALSFAQDSEKLMVCCRAGQSRSAAVAFLICFQQQGPDAAYRLLNPKRHLPNELITRLGAELIEDPSLSQTIDQWRHDNAHINLSTFVPEIAAEFDDLERQGAQNRIVEA